MNSHHSSGWFDLVFVGFMVIFALIAGSRHRKAMLALARRLDLTYQPASEGTGLHSHYAFLDQLAQGRDRRACDILRGKYRGHPVIAFQFSYREGKERHCFSFFILTLPKPLPEITIGRASWLSRLAGMGNRDGVDFEYKEFSREFRVCTDNERYANDICNMEVMQYLLNNRDLNVEIEKNALAIGFDRVLKLEEIQPNLDRLVALRELLSWHLFSSDGSDGAALADSAADEQRRADVPARYARGETW